METIWNRIEIWLVANAPEILNNLQPGATDEAIKQAEIFLGIELPEDVKASYRLHNGQDGYNGLMDGWELLSLERMMDEWKIWKELLDSGDFDDSKSDPDSPIQADWWNAKWIPLTSNGCGDHHCLDLDPAPGGNVGQIITMWHDWERREIVASRFQNWLEQLAADLESGKYIFSKEDGGLVEVNE